MGYDEAVLSDIRAQIVAQRDCTPIAVELGETPRTLLCRSGWVEGQFLPVQWLPPGTVIEDPEPGISLRLQAVEPQPSAMLTVVSVSEMDTIRVIFDAAD
jgi:hypothetical protein